MELKEFIDRFNIDLDALSRIKKRVWVVGRFHHAGDPKNPDVFLFTNRGNIKYAPGTFTHIYDMRYEDFVQALRPAIAEQVIPKGPYQRFARVKQVIPQSSGAQQGASVIDMFNYFFQRAVANSDQEGFQNNQPGLPRELLQGNEKQRGKAIFGQVRKNLRTFCEFQPKTHEIVKAVARLLGDIANEHGLPPYAAGGALPGGFPEKLIDFVYGEDTRARFSAEGLDFGGQWEQLRRDDAAREMFENVVSAFRDSLHGSPAAQYNAVRFRNRALSKIAQENISEDLRKEFLRASNAFNGLRQILRSKVLLAMVLEWLVDGCYDIDDVKAIPDGKDHQEDRDVAVETAILQRWKENGLAKPVKRPSPEERRRFSKQLTESFEKLLEAVLADDAAAEEKLSELPGDVRALGESLRRDPEKRRLLSAVSGRGTEMGDELQKAFVDASKTVLLDVLCPTLYRNPVLSKQMLKQYFRQETMAAYLTAVFLADSSQDAIRKIAEDHIDFFEKKIDDTTKKIRDTDEIMGRLLADFVDVLAKPEMQRRLTEGIRVLNEVHVMLDKTEADKERGAGSISAIRPSESTERIASAMEKTPMNLDMIEDVVRIGVRQAAASKMEASVAAAAPAAGASASGGGSGAPDRPESGSAGTATAEPVSKSGEEKAVVDSGTMTSTRLQKKIDEILEKLPTETMTPQELDSWTAAASDQILEDKRFVGSLADDVRAFEKTMHLIYARYEDNPDKKTFRNKVERMTLVNMMLLFQKDLGLGEVSSNLYQLLLDMVLYLDPEKLDPRDFLRERSLTTYFDDADLADGGITALRETLDVQGKDSLANIVNFVSELRGVKHLMDAVAPDNEAEVIVVNATAAEFVNWLKADNLTSGEGRGRMRSGMLVKTGGRSDETVPPGLVYLTDIAFPDGAKGAWIESLRGDAQLSQGALSMVLPPMCLSTGAQESGQFLADASSWARSAADASAPIVVCGPSPYLNAPGDGFPSTLPAGYLLCAHVLSAPEQKLKIKAVGERSEGRMRVIGSGNAPMRESLQRVIWGEGSGDTYSFAVDFYLYIVLTLMATGMRYEGEESPDPEKFYDCFYLSKAVMNKKAYLSSKIIDRALIGNSALRFAMDQHPAVTDLLSVSLGATAQADLSDNETRRNTITTVNWFNAARKRAGLP
jgi:hypothetical protein